MNALTLSCESKVISEENRMKSQMEKNARLTFFMILFDIFPVSSQVLNSRFLYKVNKIPYQITLNSEGMMMNDVKVPLPFAKEHLFIQTLGEYTTIDVGKGLKVAWDGHTSIYVEAPASISGKTCGLCGNFNGNRDDDFMTPEVRICSSGTQRTHSMCVYA